MTVIHAADKSWFANLWERLKNWFKTGAINIASYLVESLSNNVIRKVIEYAGNKFLKKDKTYSLPNLGIKLLFSFPQNVLYTVRDEHISDKNRFRINLNADIAKLPKEEETAAP
jgi:hypothetical protein